MEARVAEAGAMQARDGAVDESLVAILNGAAGPIGIYMRSGRRSEGS